IQPVADPKITKNPANLLQHIIAGLYDANTRAIAASMNAYGGPAYLRWGPEADAPSAVGPDDWVLGPDNSGSYVASYPRRSTDCASDRNNLDGQYTVWSSIGSANFYLYFPGYDFVDYVSAPVFGWSLYGGDSGSAFNKQLASIYPALSSFGKLI